VVGLLKDPEDVRLMDANSLLPKPLATCCISAILHHQNSGSDSGSAGSNDSNRHAALQDGGEEEVSDATTDILSVEEIPELVQEGTALAQPDSNETPDNIQVEVAEPAVEGGIAPREEDPQPDGVVSSKDVDFVKVESEQHLPSIRRPTN